MFVVTPNRCQGSALAGWCQVYFVFVPDSSLSLGMVLPGCGTLPFYENCVRMHVGRRAAYALWLPCASAFPVKS